MMENRMESMLGPEKEPEMREIKLGKGEQQFTIRYETGQEAAVKDELERMVENKELDFDWFDASVVKHQVEIQEAEAAKKTNI